MGDWAGVTDQQVQEFIVSLMGGGLAALAVWAVLQLEDN